ncbi:MAG: M48 family peptidase [Oxalobacter sp.]|nr:MAG: M48 family peptidase [Oxalobacter sp.]
MHKIRRDPDYLDDAPLSDYLNRIGNSMLAKYPEARGETGNDFEFFAVRDLTLNAFALPGGYIAIHSGLILSTQSESELASVIAHEIGHVAQRHIARMMGQQKQDMLIPLAAVAAAALAARSSPDAAQALLAGGLGASAQRQLNFSREAEREADRIGFQILGSSGYDPSGMTVFFGRMQTATRAYSDATPAYLRTHPMTTERIADIQARIREMRYRQRADSLDYHLIRARVRLLQDHSTHGLIEAERAFKEQLALKLRMQTISARYGLALVALQRGDHVAARKQLQQARKDAKDQQTLSKNPLFASTSIDVHMAARNFSEAAKEANHARHTFTLSRGFVYQYADALLAADHSNEATNFLRDQVQQYRAEPKLHRQLAKAYSAQDKRALMHLALAEAYELSGSLPAALEQLSLARQAPDATYYEHSVIDAREREWQARRREQLKQSNKQK